MNSTGTISKKIYSTPTLSAISAAAALLIYIIYKLRFLKAGYFWDEAWPYAVAVRTMHAKGLSLLPGAIDPELSRGHPLVFHFMAASWMKLFGKSLVSGHSFALTVTVATAIITYLFCKRLLSAPVGALAVLLLLCQPTIIFQGAFLLPEVTVAMWTMASFYCYFTNKKWAFVVCATALILTKEPGLMLVASLMLSESVAFVAKRPRQWKQLFYKYVPLSTPVLLASSFFVIQKVVAGWFFLPLYTNVLKSPIAILRDQLPSAAAYVFVYQGRNGMGVLMLAAVITIVIRKINIPPQHKKICLYLFSFVGCYLVFSAGNYFMPRYLACLFPPLIIVCAYLLYAAFSRNRLIITLMATGLSATFLYYYNTEPDSGDCNYLPAINVTTRAVNYCETHIKKEKFIYTTCVLRYDLGEPYAGYLSGPAFRNLQTSVSPETDYCIFWGSEGGNEELAQASRSYKLELCFTATEGKQWCSIYKVIK